MFGDPRQRSIAIGVWITSFSAGGGIGPVVGGVLLERLWWGSVFLVTLPVMALLLVLGPRVLSEYRPRLLRVPAFNASLAVNLLGIFIAVGYFLFVAQYLQLVLGLSPLRAGLWSLPSAGGLIIGSNLAPQLLRRIRPAQVIGVGLATAAVGLGLLTQVGGSADLAILVAASCIVSLGLAPVFTAATDLIVSSAPPERAGAASGISDRQRARWSARHRGPGQHRGGHLPRRTGQHTPGRRPEPGGDGAEGGRPAGEPVQLIRTGGGCVACPGEHGKPTGPLPPLRRPGPSPSDRGAGAA
jgi:predicted MFS family arabinose efflux permease